MKTRNTDHNITRASRTANKQHNRGSNRRAKRNAQSILLLDDAYYFARIEKEQPMDATAVLTYVAAKYPDALASPVAVACREASEEQQS